MGQFQKMQLQQKKLVANTICFANVGCSPTPRQHFWKIVGSKNFCLPAACLWKTICIRFGKAGAHPQPCLRNRNCPWNLIFYYNLLILKGNCDSFDSLLDFCFISLFGFVICFANVGCSPTPRQHFWKTAAPKNFSVACGSYPAPPIPTNPLPLSCPHSLSNIWQISPKVVS